MSDMTGSVNTEEKDRKHQQYQTYKCECLVRCSAQVGLFFQSESTCTTTIDLGILVPRLLPLPHKTKRRETYAQHMLADSCHRHYSLSVKGKSPYIIHINLR